MKSKVAVIKTKPETVINDIVNMCEMAENKITKDRKDQFFIRNMK